MCCVCMCTGLPTVQGVFAVCFSVRVRLADFEDLTPTYPHLGSCTSAASPIRARCTASQTVDPQNTSDLNTVHCHCVLCIYVLCKAGVLCKAPTCHSRRPKRPTSTALPMRRRPPQLHASAACRRCHPNLTRFQRYKQHAGILVRDAIHDSCPLRLRRVRPSGTPPLLG